MSNFHESILVSVSNYENANEIRDLVENLDIGKYSISRFGKNIKICHFYNVFCFPERMGLKYSLILKNEFQRLEVSIDSFYTNYNESGKLVFSDNFKKEIREKILKIFKENLKNLLSEMFVSAVD